MRMIAIPYSGELLLAHLMSYGLLVALDAAGVSGYVHHPSASLSFTPALEVDDEIDDETIATAVRATAAAAEDVVEADLVPGTTGNDRRSVIWARGSMANDLSQAGSIVVERAKCVGLAAEAGDHALLGVLAGLGAPASWGGDGVKPSQGATKLDGVLGNHTSDIVRGVLRPARKAAGAVAGDVLWATKPTKGDAQLDKTGWAPPRTPAPLAHQWLAILGLGLLPVAHRPLEPSATPACWTTRRPTVHGVTLPLVARASSLARVRAILALKTLAADPEHSADGDVAATAELRALGVPEVVVFERLSARGQGSSVAFSFRRGRRVAL
jgi:hypothetical protein